VLKAGLDQPLKTCNDHRGEGHWSVVIQECWTSSLGHKDKSGPLEAGWDHGVVNTPWLVNTGASWLAQVFSTRPVMPSEPAAFLVFMLNQI